MVLEALGARAARLRAPAAAARPRRQEALEAPRRRVGAGAARRRLSARGGAQLPGAARLGLRRRDDLLHTDELIERFSLERVSKNPAVFDEQKLRWMNGHYLREMDPDELHGAARGALRARPACARRWAIAQEKMQTLDDFWPLAGFLVERQPRGREGLAKVMEDGAAERLARARDALAGAEPFDPEHVEAALRARGGRAGSQAERGLPADEGGNHAAPRCPRDLRIGRRPGPRRDPRAHRRGARARRRTN